MSAFFMGCNTLTTSNTAPGAPAQTAANQPPVTNAAQSTEGPRPAFLTPRSDGTYVDVNGRVLVPPAVMLGLTMEQPGEALSKHLNINPSRTTLLVDIIPGQPGDKAGLMDHDIVIAVNGSPNASTNDIRNLLKKMKPGDTITFMIHAGSFAPPNLSSAAERQQVPRELMPVIDRLNHIEQQLNEIQAELKKSPQATPR